MINLYVSGAVTNYAVVLVYSTKCPFKIKTIAQCSGRNERDISHWLHDYTCMTEYNPCDMLGTEECEFIEGIEALFNFMVTDLRNTDL